MRMREEWFPRQIFRPGNEARPDHSLPWRQVHPISLCPHQCCFQHSAILTAVTVKVSDATGERDGCLQEPEVPPTCTYARQMSAGSLTGI